LEEVRKMNYNSMGNNINISYDNSISLYDCFLYNQKTVLFSGSNKNYCNICNQLSESLYTSKIFSSPLILILILNRGKNNIYNVKLHFTEKINITEFILQRDMPQMIYELYGVITHIGKSGPNAHFVASCRSSVDNKWYRFNDALINPIHNLERDVLDFGTPYILFYKKINN
jgi:ubiquitin C-terminal hydrolase